MNGNSISEKDVDAIIKMKRGKVMALDEVSVKMITKSDKAELLMGLCNACYLTRKVPDGQKRACIVPIYKGKGSRNRCKNYNGRQFVSVPYDVARAMRIIIQRVINVKEVLVEEEQYRC